MNLSSANKKLFIMSFILYPAKRILFKYFAKLPIIPLASHSLIKLSKIFQEIHHFVIFASFVIDSLTSFINEPNS